ncbi:MAG: S41 family peptidase [Gammaproteobacteria bacterium]|nr:S41 family peptidase [Gammaproteobacteria bacterium]
MAIKYKLIYIFFFTSALASPIYAGQPVPQTEAATEETPSSSATEIPLEQLQNFANVVNTIKHFYVKPVNDKELFDNAIRGMLAGLDPHSGFLDKTEFEELKTSTTGKFGGLGIEVTMEDGFVKVIAPLDDTPAHKAGVKPGDLIVKIDKTPVKGLSLKEAVDLMRGKPGSEIALVIVRQNAATPLELKIARDIIKIKSVKSEILQDYYGYIRISQFQADTEENVIKAYNDLKTKAKDQKLQGLVLDLRNNPGGILTGAIKVSDIFLDNIKYKNNPVIVSTKGRIPDSDSSSNMMDGDLTNNLPIVVLVNKGSASASEIVAGALQDHKRAIIMGTPTFGKGSVQTVLPLKADRGLKLTTALYYTPSGKSIQAMGITPDIIVDDLEVKNRDKKFSDITEADLKAHLANGNSDTKDQLKLNIKVESDKTENKPANPAPDQDQNQDNPKDANNADASTDSKTDKTKFSLAEEDYQLNEAVNVLKGLSVTSRN